MIQSRSLRFLLLASVVLLLGLGASQLAFAQGKDDKGGMPQMSNDEMQKMMALAQPGPEHKAMDKCVGDWKTKTKMWMGPGEPTVSEGTAHSEWLLGGRYLQTQHHGSMNNMPFEGMEISGYDNVKKQYFSIWLDNMGTGYMETAGQATPDGKGMTLSGTYFEPSQMKDVSIREEIQWTGDKSYTFTMYSAMPGPDGKPQEMKVMEMTAEKQ